MILDDIIQHKQKEIAELKQRFPEKRLIEALEENLTKRDVRSFARAIGSGRGTNIIAEIKKASPSHGLIREDFNPLMIAELYELGGAKALSVLTETKYFLGRPSYLKTIRKVTKLPILRKDFILEPYQVYESSILSADAILLIACILSEQELFKLIQLAKKLGMDALVEVHSEEDLLKALAAKAEIIGINNRNLMTLEVNIKTAEHLLPKIPKGKIVVAESGFEKREEIDYYRSLGVHAFLIGTSLMRSNDILSKLKSLKGHDA
ncbi:MAG: indole-3-glycerol phosphate synthase TrpC [Candidatus Omnitrophica bacterium]|nr:indole-3-glycerol phosphate synthase TrpC [Candidatus Omnitrophota bacterium]